MKLLTKGTWNFGFGKRRPNILPPVPIKIYTLHFFFFYCCIRTLPILLCDQLARHVCTLTLTSLRILFQHIIIQIFPRKRIRKYRVFPKMNDSEIFMYKFLETKKWNRTKKGYFLRQRDIITGKRPYILIIHLALVIRKWTGHIFKLSLFFPYFPFQELNLAWLTGE